MTFPFLDLGAASDELGDELSDAVARVANSGRYVLGPEVEAFEESFAQYVGTRFCIGVANGFDALRLSLIAMGVENGDEVIVPGHTFAATWLAAAQAGAIPVPVDVDGRTYNVAMEAVEAAITPKTRVILPVHLYGQPADMDPLLALADHHHLKVLEDSCQAHGAGYKDRRVGALALAAAWSFYPSKNLGGLGDGGAVTTNDEYIADRIRSLRHYGMIEGSGRDPRGSNSRLDELQAAALRVKLRHLDVWNARRRNVAARYTGAFADASVTPPFVPDWADPVWHQYVITTSEREEFRRFLGGRGVPTAVHYPVPPHRQPAFSAFRASDLPVTEALALRVVSLPVGPHMQDEDVERTIHAVREFGEVYA